MILSTHGVIASQIQSFVGLLDLYPSAAAAYSLRKLRSAYTGSAIRVRRSSDNAEQDIGFSSGNLDTTALTSFCSGTNGFVTTWYDQSGNGRNQLQTTAANQPQVVSSGSVLTLNSKPSLLFSSSKMEALWNANLTSISNFVIGSMNSSTQSFGRILTNGGNGNDYGADNLIPLLRNSTNNQINSYYLAPVAAINISLSTQFLFSQTHNGTVLSNYINNGSASTFIFVLSQAITKTAIGNITTGTSGGDAFLNGRLNEIIMYYTNESSNRSAINTNINTYYGIY
jgi:3D (Asp-Asp-Asp) domain-containing protein